MGARSKAAGSIKHNRQKISTTVSAETMGYLEEVLRTGGAKTMAEAVDIAVTRLRQAEQQQRLEAATAAYFDSLPAESAEEENQLEQGLMESAKEVDFDR